MVIKKRNIMNSTITLIAKEAKEYEDFKNLNRKERRKLAKKFLKDRKNAK